AADAGAEGAAEGAVTGAVGTGLGGSEANGAASAEAAGAIAVDALGAAAGRANGVTLEPAPCGKLAGAFATSVGASAGLTSTCVAGWEAAETGACAFKVVERRLDSASPLDAGPPGGESERLGALKAPGRLATAIVAVWPDDTISPPSSGAGAATAAARDVVVGCLPAASAWA